MNKEYVRLNTMCGIFALMSSIDEMTIRKEFMKGRPRGPECSTIEKLDIVTSNNPFYFGFHRLAINGLNTTSNQPLVFDNIKLICNGEIYNYKQLYKQMGITPVTQSDCEVIIHLYIKYGIEQTLRMLDGVFAFVLFDNSDIMHPKLCVARDPYGVRPLYQTNTHNSNTHFHPILGFASEMKMLHNISCTSGDNVDIIHFKPGSYSVYTMVDEFWKPVVAHVPYTMISSTDLSDLNDNSVDEIECNITRLLKSAVKKRVETTERPIACLLSGGLDSSLICALVQREVTQQTGKKIETYSIGLPGSDDLKYARIVANHLGTKHCEVVVSEQEMLDAIPDVIYKIESYDTTTIRASVGNYLVANYISKNSLAKVIFNGDGADELTGGYLYFHQCPDSIEFDKECKRLLTDLHCYDVLRSDKSISSNGLEARTPFLDRSFVQYYMSIHPDIRNHVLTNKCEKHLLRSAFSRMLFDGKPLLPDEVLWRTKEAFSDGVSKQTRSWYEIIQEHVETIDDDMTYTMYVDHNIPVTKEQMYYRHLFEKNYEGRSHIIKYFWMPKYVDALDSSARTLTIYDSIHL